MGVKLFAWVGGFALFLAVAFFVKYSFDNNLITPSMRVALGYLVGLGLLVGGVVLKRKAYAVTSQTLCGSGVVILYAVTFAAHARYNLIPSSAATFALMVLVTATAFLLAVRLDAVAVAILGLLGGFLTPPLVSTGVDRPLGLFGYVAILDVGLAALAFRKRWHFLLVLAALGTVLTQLGWAHEFFQVDKVLIALAIFAVFNLGFLAAHVTGQRLGQADDWVVSPAVMLPTVTFGFTLWTLSYAELGARPGVLFAFLLAACLPLLGLAWIEQRLDLLHVLAGGAAFLILAIWTGRYLTDALLHWALAGYLGFAVLHTGFPVLRQRLRPAAAPVWWGHLFPVLALVLVMIPLLKHVGGGWSVWPVVLLLNALAVGLAVVTGAVVTILAALVLTVVLAALWLGQAPAELTALPPYLLIVGGLALFFFLVGLWAAERCRAPRTGTEAESTGALGGGLPEFLRPWGDAEAVRAQIPALSAILPFLLLILAVDRLPVLNPSPIYGLAMLLLALLLAVVRLTRVELLAPVGLACALALEYGWYQARFRPDLALVPLVWNVAFAAVFIAFPFVFRAAFAERLLPWATAALAGPLHFYLVYRVVKAGYPNDVMGLLPVAFAVPMLGSLAWVVQAFPGDSRQRLRLLAWFGGSALFFITLIFPIQFEKQWITLGWALEGVALLWLCRRVPHPGLRGLGVILLGVAFVRLALNPAVLEYHSRTATPIFNWFLYSYGITTVALFLGAHLLEPPPERVLGVKARGVLLTLGTILAFLLLNLEIADYFSEGSTLTFQFSGNFARDMTYSIGWAVFALVLVAAGVGSRNRAARYAGMALLGVTVLKLFLHDLVRLSALYRIGAFLGVAVISILASVLYQRFFASSAAAAEAATAKET